MGSKQKTQMNSNPGPATYDHTDSLTKSSSQQVTITHAKRGELWDSQQRDFPGPGNYENQKSTFGQTQNAPTMASRHQERLNSNPGPGQYNADSLTIKAEISGSVSMGQAKRQDLYAE